MLGRKGVCLTGGSGFIGTALGKELLRRGYQLKVLDRKAPKITEARFIKGDVLDPETLNAAFSGCRFVFHLASPVGVRETELAGDDAFKAIIEGTKNVLEACRLNKIEKLFFSSSSEVYGEVYEDKAEEGSSSIERLKSQYGRGKLESEKMIKESAAKNGFNFVINRFFNIYGPNQRTDFVLSKFAEAVCFNRPLTIYGEGSQIRSFCYIDDAVKGIADSFEKGRNEIFNIGNDAEPIDVKSLAETVKKIAGSRSQINFIPMEESDRSAGREIHRRVPDIGKARKLLDYKPRVSLNEGIGNTICHFRQSA